MTTGRDVPRVSPSERLQLKTMRAALRERPPCSGGSCGDAELAWAARSLGVLSRLPVAYLHLSKAGGTAVCSVAERPLPHASIFEAERIDGGLEEIVDRKFRGVAQRTFDVEPGIQGLELSGLGHQVTAVGR